MKKLLLSLAAAGLFLSACNHAANTTSNTADSTAKPASNINAATMKFGHDTHDFGKVKEGDKVTYQFGFINSGKSPLIISNAVASCGCTTPDWPKGPVAPGDSGKISVTFNSTGHPGLQDKMITITANTNPPQSVVHLVGEVTANK